MVVVIGAIILVCMYVSERKSDAQKAYLRGEITEEQNRKIQDDNEEGQAAVQLVLLVALAIGILMHLSSSL